MSLASILGETVTVSIGGRGFVLRPTLRAAIGVLDAGPGYEAALSRLRDREFGFALVVLAHGLDDGVTPPMDDDTWDAFADGDLVAELQRFVLILANGGEPLKPVEAGEKRAAGGKALSHGDYLARLYRFGTGWLGWSAAETLMTPMPAIVSAYLGRADMLRAIFGGSEAPPSKNDIPLDQKVRLAMAGARKVKPAAHGPSAPEKGHPSGRPDNGKPASPRSGRKSA